MHDNNTFFNMFVNQTAHQVERKDQHRVHGRRRRADGGVCVEGPSAPPDRGRAANNVFDLPGARQSKLSDELIQRWHVVASNQLPFHAQDKVNNISMLWEMNKISARNRDTYPIKNTVAM